MLQKVGIMQSPPRRSFADNQAVYSHSFLTNGTGLLFCDGDGDNTSQTEENGKTVSSLQREDLNENTLFPGPYYHVNNQQGYLGENEDSTLQPLSYSHDAPQIVSQLNERGPTNWTVRNSEGFQQELMQEDTECDSYNLLETNIGLGNTAGVSPRNNSSFPGYELDIDNIIVHLILSFPDAVDGEVWESIQSSLKISRSILQHDSPLPFPQTSLSCDQRSEEIPTSEANLAREISALISVRHYLNSTTARHLFQIYLEVKEKTKEQSQCFWDRLNILTFVQFPSTGQLLLPIETEVCRREALDSIEGTLLGSFFMENKELFHHSPNELSLRRHETNTSRQFIRQPKEFYTEEVIIVDRHDMVLEPNGARAGRPSHKETGELLMTESQVEKVLEIRKRWEGLSSRQRRDNISSSDLYTFLTLNRDETAKCLGVCATWLKDAIRAQGMNVWPGRPLRKTGAMLQTLKESLESARAALRFSNPAINETEKYKADVQRYESEIRDLVSMRAEIVKANVSAEYYEKFMREKGSQYLDPKWNALPPQPL